jgi:signal transduction histidine kinase
MHLRPAPYLLRNAVFTLALNTLIGIAITVFGKHSLWVNLLYSQCIGLSIWGLIEWGRHQFIREAEAHWRRLLWIVPLGVLIGFFSGVALADLLIGQSVLSDWSNNPRRTLGFLLVSLVSGSVITQFFLSRGHLAAARLREQTALQQASQARLRLLESQLEPHMLFNTLANLRALIATDPPRAIAMLDRLNDYLRATLSASRTEASSQRHTLALEFDRLRDYLELMAVRMGPRLRYTLVLPPELARHPLPPLLLQPLVENAIRHGLEPHVQGGEIRVEASIEGDHLLLTVSDTGAGCAGEPRVGFGLAQVRERLATAFENPARLDWHSQPGEGTRIKLQLPLAKPTPETA